MKKNLLFVFRIILIQGLNRQIRRMCEYFGYQVTKLERIRIMNISLKGIPEGDWRELTKQELEGIAKLIESSSSVPTSHSSRSKKTNPKELRWISLRVRANHPHQDTSYPSKRNMQMERIVLQNQKEMIPAIQQSAQQPVDAGKIERGRLAIEKILAASRDWYETCLYTIRDKIYQTLLGNI